MSAQAVPKLKCLASGAVTGIVNGLLGFGGGLVLLPALTRWIKLDDKQALATSIMAIVPMCILSSVIYIFRGDIDFLAAAPFIIGGLIGGYIGGRVFSSVPTSILRRVFGGIILYGAVRALIT